MDAECSAFPLSPMQNGMLVETLSGRLAGVNVEQVVIHSGSQPDPARMRAAWERAARRHDVLRMTFHWRERAEPLQCVESTVPPFWHVVAWDGTAAAWTAFLHADRTTPFAADKHAPWRFTHVREPGGTARWVWTFHHALLDGHAFAPLLAEVFADADGQPPLTAEAAPYQEFMEWLARRDAAADETFWRGELAGYGVPVKPVIHTMADDASANDDERGSTELGLSPMVATALQQRAAAWNVTMDTLVQGAWAVVLGLCSNADDVVFGMVRSLRRWNGTAGKDRIGLFVNTVPVRVRLDGTAGVRDWLIDLRAGRLTARPHECTPLADIQRWSEIPAGTTLFDTLLLFENEPWDARLRKSGGAWVERKLELHEHTGFPLSLSVYLDDGLRIGVEYDRTHLQHAAAVKLADLVARALCALSQCAPEVKLGELELLSEDERRRLIMDGTGETTDLTDGTDVHALFAQTVRRTPDNPALADGTSVLTYRELDHRAARLAWRLVTAGVIPGDVVAIILPRSLDFACAILASLKAGAVYVALEPGDPPARRNRLLAECRAKWLLARPETLPEDPPHIAVIDVVDNPSAPILETAVPPPSPLACLFFTSGSTGRPKGVRLAHRGILNHARSAVRQYGIRENDRVLQFFSPAFDGSLEEFFMTWTAGAQLVIRPPGPPPAIGEFLAFIDRERLTVLDLPTAFWHECVTVLTTSGGVWPAGVRTVIVGGEKACPHLFAAWRLIAGPQVRFFNTYGPTECTIVSTVFEPCGTGAAGADTMELPIGRPITNVTAHVLDRAGRLVPDGIAGELCIGGAGVALGYLDPEMESGYFVRDPFAHLPEMRMYRTGDRAWRRADGQLIFVGRMDSSQVKIRGVRIELGEIESVLRGELSVKEVVVVPFEPVPGRQALVAYWTARTASAGADTALRRHLETHLPTVMRPAVLCRLEAFPLTPGGKLDRRMLPPPAWPATTAAESAPPEGPDQRALAEIWHQVLGTRRIGAPDNFFDLGGHSLSAIQLVEAVQRAGFDLTVEDIFRHPTLAAMAQQMRFRLACPDGSEEWSCLVKLREGKAGRPPLFLLHLATGDLLVYASLVHRLSREQPCFGFQSRGLQNPEKAHATLEEMAAHYVRLLQEFYPRGPVLLAGWCYGGNLAQEMAVQLHALGRPVELLALMSCWAHPPVHGQVPYLLSRLTSLARLGPGAWLRFLERRRDARAKHKTWCIEEELKVLPPRGPLSQRERAYRLNAHANRLHRTTFYPGHVTLFCPEIPEADRIPDAMRGWRRLCAKLERLELPGTHAGILAEPEVRGLAAQLQERLDAAAGRPENGRPA